MPIKEFCDLCGIEHVLTKDNLAVFYAFKGNMNKEIGLETDNLYDTQVLPKYADINPDLIDFEPIFISNEVKSLIKIATVQLEYTLSQTFPFQLMEKECLREKVDKSLEKCERLGVDIICFSELSICEDWIKDIEAKYQNIIVIPGTFYDKKGHNVCKPLIDSDRPIPPQMKIIPSEPESPSITGVGMISGEKIFIYNTKFGKISILICRDFGNFIGRLSDKADIVLVPSYNTNPERFEETAHNHVLNHPSYIIISNSAIFGGTSIFGQMDRVYFQQLKKEGYKDKDSNNYKLCEIKKGHEGIIIADFNIELNIKVYRYQRQLARRKWKEVSQI